MNEAPPSDPAERARRLAQLKFLIRKLRRDLKVLEAEQERLHEEEQHEELEHAFEHPEEWEIHLDDLRHFGDDAWQEIRDALSDFKDRLADVFKRHRNK